MTTRATRRSASFAAARRKAGFAAAAGGRVAVRRSNLTTRDGSKRWYRRANDVLAAEIAAMDEAALEKVDPWLFKTDDEIRIELDEYYGRYGRYDWENDEDINKEWYEVFMAEGKEAADAAWRKRQEAFWEDDG